MAKITRYDGNLLAFASSATGTERTIFGDTAQSDTLDDNITADFFRGWGILLSSEIPTKQDFNGLAYTISQVLAYLHQVGVPEWQTAQEYHTDSVTNRNGVLYFSTVDNNTGNDPETDVSGDWVLMSAANLSYDNTDSGLVAELVQDALDELASSRIIAITITPPTDANVTLTATQASRDRLVLVDGSWAIGRDIIVPDESRRWYVDNIAGTYDAAVRTAAGAGVTVAAGTTRVLVCDAVDVLDPFNAGSAAATETAPGVAELATQPETDAGTDDLRIVTPLKLSNSPQTAAAWVSFDGTGTVSIYDAFNVNSITDNGTGRYTVNFTNAISGTGYSWAGSAFAASTGELGAVSQDATSTTKTVSALSVKTSGESGVAADRDRVNVNVLA